MISSSVSLRLLFFLINTIASSPYILYIRFSVFLQLSPDIPDVHHHGIPGIREKHFLPDGLIDLLHGKYLPRIRDQKQKNLIFHLCQRDILPVNLYGLKLLVDGKVTVKDKLLRLFIRLLIDPVPPDQRLYPG